MMPTWKWILELVLGIVIFFIVYATAQMVFMTELQWLESIVFIVSGIVIIGLFLLWARGFEKEWRLDTVSNPRKLLGGITIGALYFCIIIGILAVIGSYTAHYASPCWGIIVVNLCLNFLVACSEEVIFRGVLFRLIDERFGFWWAISISSFMFGFAHIFQPDATFWSSIAIAVEAGLLLGAAYKYTGTLWFPIGIHWAWNFTQGNVFGLDVSGDGTEESIMNATLTGPDIISGGSFGTEASIITTTLGFLLSCLFLFLIKNRKSPIQNA